ncbi:MAG: hypothetical protein HOL07_00035 [Rhodospirillaceae bacterium]|nr:hypothetical protein [Rhodospirillaceae bacterium]MBT4771414.1 hypothetical protein [Rhodospirillaceae bacterium]MBT5356712.1 hypothetical protein [Rhodospirillaceae bacterium]MBT5768946.1 hypothetical protein [Rhodospirillaceae bacterium]MBT6403086.1 hypothetical protein [Rhodospirillaceae bacterium]
MDETANPDSVIGEWQSRLRHLIGIYQDYRGRTRRFWRYLFIAFFLLNCISYQFAIMTAFPDRAFGVDWLRYVLIMFPVALFGALFDCVSFVLTVAIMRHAIRIKAKLVYLGHVVADIIIATLATGWVLIVFSVSTVLVDFIIGPPVAVPAVVSQPVTQTTAPATTAALVAPPVVQPVKPPAEPAPVTPLAEPTLVSPPAEPASVTPPAQPTPVVRPVKPPTEPAPVIPPAEPAPVTPPTEPAPVTQPAPAVTPPSDASIDHVRFMADRADGYRQRVSGALRDPFSGQNFRNIYFGVVMGVSAMLPSLLHLIVGLAALFTVIFRMLSRRKAAGTP